MKKFVFVSENNSSIIIVANDKMDAIEIYAKQFPRYFSESFRVLTPWVEVNEDRTETKYNR